MPANADANNSEPSCLTTENGTENISLATIKNFQSNEVKDTLVNIFMSDNRKKEETECSSRRDYQEKPLFNPLGSVFGNQVVTSFRPGSNGISTL